MKTKKIMALALSMLMLGSVVPMTAFANVKAEETTTGSIHDVVKVGAEGEYTTLYYGGIPWRVLSKNYSSDTTDPNAKEGFLLLSEHAMANGIRYNAHYSNNAWSSSNKAWASAMVLPWDDERNPHYESNMANGTKTDDSSGGYITSDIRMYLTGKDGSYETVRPFAYYAESWPASWDTFADRNGQGVKYYTKNLVTDTTPQEGVTYFVKGEFELSNHGRDCAEVNDVTIPGMYALTPADWAEDTWYTLDANGDPVLMTEWPEGAATVNAYYDQAGYSIADVSNGFVDGVTYYTFERYMSNVCPKVVVNGQETDMGKHLAALFKWVAYSVPEMSNSDSTKATVNEVFVNGLPASEKNFATDMGFSEAEQAAVLPTSGHGYNRGSGVRLGWSSSIGSTFGDRLDNDTYFSLSGEEVALYLTQAGHTKPCTYFDGTGAGDIWTRSWGRADIQTVITYANNAVNWYKGANNTWQSIRPAFNLNPDAVMMYKPVEGEENAYTVVLEDETRDFEVISATRKGDMLTIEYSGEVTGANEQISYVLKDRTTGEVVEYGKLADLNDLTRTTVKTLTVNVAHINTFDYDMYIFNENVSEGSSYASEMKLVELPLSEYNFTLTANKTALKASESVNVTVSIDKDYYSAEYTFTYDPKKFSCAADMDSDGKIFVSNLYKGEAGTLATYTLVALNDINSFTNSAVSVTGKVVEFKQQLLNGLENTVIGDVETIKVSLNYTAGVKADFVPGYSLVLVKGEDGGYAYNGVKMFYVEAYNAYAFLVAGNVTAEQIDEAISKTTGCERIKQSYNVNAEYVTGGIVDIKDATAAYACSILDFDVVSYMELFLRADVNGDCRVNMVDVNAIVRNYTK